MIAFQQTHFQKCFSLKKATFNFTCTTWVGGWLFLECGGMAGETGSAQWHRWGRYRPTWGRRRGRDGSRLWKPHSRVYVYLGLCRTKPIELHSTSQRHQIFIQHKTIRAIPTALWSCTEFMGLRGEEMASKEPTRKKHYWNHYKEKQSWRNHIVWDSLSEVFFILREKRREIWPMSLILTWNMSFMIGKRRGTD